MNTAARVAVVSGGTRGIGRAIVERLAAGGAHVVAIWTADQNSAKRLEHDAAKSGWSVSTMQADLSDPQACEQIASEIVSRHDRIDGLVNNAGIMIDGPIDQLTIEDWDAVVKVDLSAVFYITRCVYPIMRAQAYGRIITIGSTAGVTGSPARPNYAAAKAGLWGFTRSVARAAEGTGITANLIVVGPTDVGMGSEGPDPAVEALIARMPIGRRVRPEEVAHAVAFLADDLAAAVTGSTVFVDGGITV